MDIPLKNSQTTVMFHDDEYDYVKRTAAERRVSKGQVIRELVREAMNRGGGPVAVRGGGDGVEERSRTD